jgi:hypothetical protein
MDENLGKHYSFAFDRMIETTERLALQAALRCCISDGPEAVGALVVDKCVEGYDS